MQETILAISGKPGLYRLVARGNGTLIVETIDATRRRLPVGARDRVTSLSEVTMYTETGDEPLMQVFQNISDALQGKTTSFTHKAATSSDLEQFMSEIALPAWDRERVHTSDIRKLVQWYNILIEGGITQFVATEQATEQAETPAQDEA